MTMTRAWNRVWSLAERMDWDGRCPRPFWRWLLRKCDERAGYKFEYDRPAD